MKKVIYLTVFLMLIVGCSLIVDTIMPNDEVWVETYLETHKTRDVIGYTVNNDTVTLYINNSIRDFYIYESRRFPYKTKSHAISIVTFKIDGTPLSSADTKIQITDTSTNPFRFSEEYLQIIHSDSQASTYNLDNLQQYGPFAFSTSDSYEILPADSSALYVYYHGAAWVYSFTNGTYDKITSNALEEGIFSQGKKCYATTINDTTNFLSLAFTEYNPDTKTSKTYTSEITPLQYDNNQTLVTLKSVQSAGKGFLRLIYENRESILCAINDSTVTQLRDIPMKLPRIVVQNSSQYVFINNDTLFQNTHISDTVIQKSVITPLEQYLITDTLSTDLFPKNWEE